MEVGVGSHAGGAAFEGFLLVEVFEDLGGLDCEGLADGWVAVGRRTLGDLVVQVGGDVDCLRAALSVEVEHKI
jgi:hypothetical protein